MFDEHVSEDTKVAMVKKRFGDCSTCSSPDDSSLYLKRFCIKNLATNYFINPAHSFRSFLQRPFKSSTTNCIVNSSYLSNVHFVYPAFIYPRIISSIHLPVKQYSFHPFSLYLAKNYFIKPASNKQLNTFFTIKGRIIRGRIVETSVYWGKTVAPTHQILYSRGSKTSVYMKFRDHWPTTLEAYFTRNSL